VKRRICVVGVALSAGSVAFGVAPALAARHKVTKPKKKPAIQMPVATTCTTNTAIMIGPGVTTLTPPVQGGHEYGVATCGDVLGRGVQGDTFAVQDSGDTVATYTLWFLTGTIRGKFDLTPQEGDLNFTTTSYTGTMTITGGTGQFFGATGSGTMTCASDDGIHNTCTDKLNLTKL
jgi:hypothetical protein